MRDVMRIMADLRADGHAAGRPADGAGLDPVDARNARAGYRGRYPEAENRFFYRVVDAQLSCRVRTGREHGLGGGAAPERPQPTRQAASVVRPRGLTYTRAGETLQPRPHPAASSSASAREPRQPPRTGPAGAAGWSRPAPACRAEFLDQRLDIAQPVDQPHLDRPGTQHVAAIEQRRLHSAFSRPARRERTQSLKRSWMSPISACTKSTSCGRSGVNRSSRALFSPAV